MHDTISIMIILDVEASGTEPQLHSVVSIGAVSLIDPENRFYKECRMWEGADIMDGALEVNGFTKAQIIDPEKPSEAEAVQHFLEWSQHFADRTLAGQNPSFDRDMLKAAAHRAHLNWDLAYRTIDSHSLCYMHIVKAEGIPPIDEQRRRSSLDLDAILNYCGIPEEPRPHNALTGALCHAEVISRLLYDRKLMPEFEAYEIPWI